MIVSFWVILLLLCIGFFFGFAFGGFLYSRSVETISQNHVDAVKHITKSYDERARRSREANKSVLSYVTGGNLGVSDSDENTNEDDAQERIAPEAKKSNIGELILVAGEDYVPSRGDVDDEGTAATVSFESATQGNARQSGGASSRKWVPLATSVDEVDQEIVPDSFTHTSEQVFGNEDSDAEPVKDSSNVGVYDSTETEQSETEFVTSMDESNGLVDADDESSLQKESDNDFSIGTINVENLIGGGSFKSDFQDPTSVTGGSTIFRR